MHVQVVRLAAEGGMVTAEITAWGGPGHENGRCRLHRSFSRVIIRE
jgi:hypothetical protein